MATGTRAKTGAAASRPGELRILTQEEYDALAPAQKGSYTKALRKSGKENEALHKISTTQSVRKRAPTTTAIDDTAGKKKRHAPAQPADSESSHGDASENATMLLLDNGLAQMQVGTEDDGVATPLEYEEDSDPEAVQRRAKAARGKKKQVLSEDEDEYEAERMGDAQNDEEDESTEGEVEDDSAIEKTFTKSQRAKYNSTLPKWKGSGAEKALNVNVNTVVVDDFNSDNDDIDRVDEARERLRAQAAQAAQVAEPAVPLATAGGSAAVPAGVQEPSAADTVAGARAAQRSHGQGHGARASPTAPRVAVATASASAPQYGGSQGHRTTAPRTTASQGCRANTAVVATPAVVATAVDNPAAVATAVDNPAAVAHPAAIANPAIVALPAVVAHPAAAATATIGAPAGNAWPANTDVVAPTGKQGHMAMGAQTERVKKVLRQAIKTELPIKLFFQNAYPQPLERPAFFRGVLVAAAEAIGDASIASRVRLDREYAAAISKIPEARMSNLRGRLKDAADAVVPGAYNINSFPPDRHVRIMKWLLAEDEHLYIFPGDAKENTYDDSLPFLHEAILAVIRMVFFGPKAMAEFPPALFSGEDGVLRLPAAMVAASAAAVEAGLRGYLLGRDPAQVDFAGNQFFRSYMDHMATFHDLKSESPGTHDALLARLFASVSGVEDGNHAGAATAAVGTSNRRVSAARVAQALGA
ncbi:hypothetical protein FA95DRAFT_1612786 [Auriscalpium vulgare]|uniref:Uncharacterized protein n=1 Tax=Auriscalpium vulgare TaxID=40419 RepID=A0ACB8R4X4_9AGAM|nr:hypothetical protein FA95DRAFT_1612786 [Auriscalpium vulgare]